MGLFEHGVRGRGCVWFGAVAWVGLCCGSCGWGQARARVKSSPWDAAVAARQAFEEEAAGTHTKAEYAAVMDGFRAIYHGDPGDAHAARAVEQVAELLEEQGTEFADKKSLKDAAGQFDFLAKAYPGYAREEKARLAAAKLGGDVVVAKTPNAQKTTVRASAGVSATPSQRREASASDDAAAVAATKPEATAGPMAVVTGIRHWSTATYTRVAIDLAVDGDEDVKYEAARVVHPDRLFFDLHHAKLAPGMVGKTFSITDDGFLTKIRAAQAGDDVTRVVLDVHAVGEYSAFLLPNPMRLIIDIHGKQEVGKQEAGSRKQEVGTTVEGAGDSGQALYGGDAATSVESPVAPSTAAVAAPVVRTSKAGAAEVSSLPPMPVTDGSAGFGLGAKSSAGVAKSGTAAAQPVARPRVVISSKPTVARPVPNTVAKSSSEMGSEVAAVSSQPGKVEATSRPTSQPISAGSREQEVGNSGSGASGDHYVPRSKRVAPADASAAGNTSAVAPNASSKLDGTKATASTTDTVALVATTSSSKRRVAKGSVVSAAPVEAAPPTADGETSLVRALGLKIGRIVIDAGHGGHDSGTLGAGGIQEKDVVLDVALRLGKLLHDRLGAEIVYTRADDTFIPLETRTAIANKAQADLFISVHANSSPEPSARGVEVYYLNFTSDPEAMKVASRENAVSTQSVHELSDLVKKIALKDKIEESKELAGDVDSSLYAGLTKGNEGLKDRGVKKAPFVVLIGANMPSILAEISFVTNPDDAEQLQTPEYRERVAESLYGGVARYAAGINGKTKAKVKLATR